MLVLRRGKRQSVVIGDQITVTVEDFNDAGDGRRLFGATVGLGFEMPRYVSVYRDELRARRSSGPHSGKDAPPKQPRPGNLVEVSDAVVRLRIQVPRKVPVRHNGTPTVGHDMEEGADGPTTVYHVTCRKEDRITICNNIIVAALGFHRFVPREHNACL
jgi:sRNA-binding carbon storage regulator CsrA